MNTAKYRSEEILQILIGSYNCQAVFDPEVCSGENLTFETTISEWRNICDLIEPKELAKVYHDYFKLSTPLIELEGIFFDKKNDLKFFCNYISANAVKQVISPIVLFEKSCMTAAIFKTLITNLQERGVKVQNIKPSSEFIPLFYKHGDILMSEVNKLAPGTLNKFEHQDNWITKTGIYLIWIFFALIIVVPFIWHFHGALLIPLALGPTFMFIGSKFKPAKEVIGGYETVRDLILGMESQLNKAV